MENCGPQDSEQLIFGQLAWGLNHLGLMLLRAPVPVVVCANHDDFFPIDGTLETMRALGRAADRLGCADRFALADVAGKHGWTRGTMTASVDWMRRWLTDVRLRRPPPSWADAIRRAVTEPVQWTYTDSVQGALLSYDWPELLMNTEACGGAGRMLGD